MEQVYNAEIQNNQIRWVDKEPLTLKKNRKYRVRVILEESQQEIPELEKTGKDLVDFFRNSPLFGVELDLERSKDYGRDIEL